MRGFPKTIATRKDIDNLMLLYPEQTKAHIKRLLEGRYVWQQTGVVADGKIGVVDATHQVIDQVDEAGKVTKVQMEKKEDPNAKLFRLGLTAEEAEKIVGKTVVIDK